MTSTLQFSVTSMDENEAGKSPTELEFQAATKTHRERLIFVKGDDDKARAPKMATLVKKGESSGHAPAFFRYTWVDPRGLCQPCRIPGKPGCPQDNAL